MQQGARKTTVALWLLTLLCACVTRNAPTAPAPADAAQLRYHVRLEQTLGAMDVELCFSGLASRTLIPGRSEASGRVRWARWLSPGARSRLAVERGRIQLPPDASQGCIEYHVQLDEGGSLSAFVSQAYEHLIASPNAWLWRPYKRAANIQAQLRVTLPPGIRASLPWRHEGDHYELDASAFAYDSHAVFGPFREVSVQTRGIEARAALLDVLQNRSDDDVRAWLGEAVSIAAQSSGRFPARGLQLIVIGQPFGNEPFGSVARGGGASVLLFLPKELSLVQLRRDWVLPHELSHLLIPFVEREDAWLAEGLATYYQEVVRARAGILTPLQALDNMASAMRSAARQGTGRTLCEESRAMHQTSAYRPVYWGGAGHWLNVDVALRKQGKPSLDWLLTRVREQARVSPPYAAEELLTLLDELSDSKLFSALRDGCEREHFPPFEASLRALGYVDGALIADESAAALRTQLFAAQRE